ncbi:flagellar export chaperone FlgN [Desulfobacter curvatus]|uniref:flagellar export chaperone FlgN n=1 Tax=Desulfobacter curvatus TaxID=2290 RepID=UPI00036E117F|nr:flagellar export chaperone FlgN [Desulfobacter curvatus]
MILPLIKPEVETDSVAVLERKMIRLRALYKELIHIIDAEYAAGMAYDSKSLKKLVLRQQNCVNRFEHLNRSMGKQLGMMAGREMPSTMPKTLVNRVKMIRGLTPKQEDELSALANDLEQKHRKLMQAASRNSQLFKRVLNRLSVTSKYVNHRNMGAP